MDDVDVFSTVSTLAHIFLILYNDFRPSGWRNISVNTEYIFIN